jgi:hypothetical protein
MLYKQNKGNTKSNGSRKGIIQSEHPHVKNDATQAKKMVNRMESEIMKQPAGCLNVTWTVVTVWRYGVNAK